MATSLEELIAQRDALDRQIREAKSSARAQAIAKVRALMAEHGLTAADIAPETRKASKVAGTTVKPKYRDPATGATWTGRGLKPKWLVSELQKGRPLSEFTI